MAFDFLYNSPLFLSQVSYSEERFRVFSQLTVTTPAGLLGNHLCVALWPPGHSWLRKGQSCDPGQSSFFYTFEIWREKAKDQLTFLLQRVDLLKVSEAELWGKPFPLAETQERLVRKPTEGAPVCGEARLTPDSWPEWPVSRCLFQNFPKTLLTGHLCIPIMYFSF